MTLFPLGDSAVVIALGDHVDPATAAQVQAVRAEIERHRPVGVSDVVAAFATVAVFYEPGAIVSYDALCADLKVLVDRADATLVSLPVRTVEVPVCYGGDFGPDLEVVAKHHRLSVDEVVARHAGADYLVYAIGFSPGFPYLGGLPESLATPRRATPRARVPAGSVGIGGKQTGIYPSDTPGGWNLIGRTPLPLFDAHREHPSLLGAGDHVKFRAISPAEFTTIAEALRSETPRDTAGEPQNGHAPPEMPGGLEIVRPGMFTTVQDLGRKGYRAGGVPLSGAADAFALRLANLLVGNPEDAAGLEFTLVGPEIVFQQDTVVALTGADFGGPPLWRPCEVKAGTRLQLGQAKAGYRGYLAVAGGIQVAPVLGSQSTYVRAALGGLGGRTLRAGDRLLIPAVQRHFRDHWWIDHRILPEYSAAPVIRIVDGAQGDSLERDWVERKFLVSPQSDRMGVRLAGEAVRRPAAPDLVSSPVAPGTIQVPPDGHPIILLADGQTIGGYPQVAHVISVDLPLVAQLRPGDAVRFRRVTLSEAHQFFSAQERSVALLREGVAQKLA